jgi:conjugative transfer pilus assembly protein TraH
MPPPSTGAAPKASGSSTTAQGSGKYDDVNPAVARNYTWTILKKSAFFSPNGTFDEELAEYAMTLLGTIIYVPPKDDEPGKFVPIVGEASSTLVTSLLDGTSSGNVLIFDCDEPEKCLDPGFKSLSLPASKALRPRVAALIAGMIQAIHDDTAITDAQKELLQVASIPLYKILTVQAAYGRGMPTDDRETLAEIASVDLLFAVLDRIVSEAGRSMSSFIGADEAKIAMWQGQVNVVRQALADRQANTHLKVNAIMQIIEKTAFIENVLAASMSPSAWPHRSTGRAACSRAPLPTNPFLRAGTGGSPASWSRFSRLAAASYLVNVFQAVAAWTGNGGYKSLLQVVMVMGLGLSAIRWPSIRTGGPGSTGSLARR